MRKGLTITGIVAAGLLAAGFMAATPAYAASGNQTAYVFAGTGNQYLKSCNSPGTCNAVTAGTLELEFGRSGTPSPPQTDLGVFYHIINGTAVDGTDFNTPVTGEAIIPAGQWIVDLTVPLVNEQQFGTSKTFTVEITGTTKPITVSPASSTATILGGNVPLDCSFTYISGTSQSMTCTQRPATQVWNIQAWCRTNMGPPFLPMNGSQVTGDGTSTLSNCTELNRGTFNIDS
jgi:hypothetical protein